MASCSLRMDMPSRSASPEVGTIEPVSIANVVDLPANRSGVIGGGSDRWRSVVFGGHQWRTAIIGGNQAERSRLTRAVDAEEAEALAELDAQAKVAHRHFGAKFTAQVLEEQGCRGALAAVDEPPFLEHVVVLQIAEAAAAHAQARAQAAARAAVQAATSRIAAAIAAALASALGRPLAAAQERREPAALKPLLQRNVGFGELQQQHAT